MMIVPLALGSRWRKKIRRSEAPRESAAWTNSRSRSEEISARTTRAIGTQR